MALFDQLGVSHVIHCGDVGGSAVFEELAGRPCTFVWGNTDEPDQSLLIFLRTVGLRPPERVPTTIELGGKTFAIFHGHERGFEAAIDCLEVDYVLHGHTHEPRDEFNNGKRIVNPGALHRARRPTVATVDTVSDQVILYDLTHT